MAVPSEQAFETAVCESLTSTGGYTSVKVCNAAEGADADFAVDTEQDFMTTPGRVTAPTSSRSTAATATGLVGHASADASGMDGTVVEPYS